MKKILKEGMIVLVIYLLITLFMFAAANRLERLENTNGLEANSLKIGEEVK